MKYIKLYENYHKLSIGDNTNYGEILDETDIQYYFKNNMFPKGSWIHKSIVKKDDLELKNQPLRNKGTISPEYVISAFANPIEDEKVNNYSREMEVKMLEHNFPPIKGYPIIIDENDIERYGKFLSGNDITINDVGRYAWVVTDGHHRVISALIAHLPFLKTILDYSYIDENDFIE